jgi:alpha-tubulin suppressor-like RCC1 family protein
MGKSPIKGKAGKVSTSSTEIIELDLFDIKKIQSGQNFSIALNKEGKVFVWGNNVYGQLGTGSLRN